MTSSRGRTTFTIAALLGALSLPGAARGQRTAQDIESARQLYNEGMGLKEKGDLRGALEKLRAAHALGNTPVTGLELCRTHAALKQPVEAREVCLGVARIPPLAQETQRSQEARAEAARLAEVEKPKIAALRIKVTGVPAGQEPTVVVDGATVPAAALGQPRAVDPGTHTLGARVGGGVETKASLETAEGETRDVELVVRPPPTETSEAPQTQTGTRSPVQSGEAPRAKRSNAAGITLLAVGGAAVLVGGIAGLVAIGKESDLDAKCIDKRCGRDLHGELDSAETWGNVSTALFIVGGVGLAGGLLFTLLSSARASKSASLPPTTPRITPTLGLGGAGIHGVF